MCFRWDERVVVADCPRQDRGGYEMCPYWRAIAGCHGSAEPTRVGSKEYRTRLPETGAPLDRGFLSPGNKVDEARIRAVCTPDNPTRFYGVYSMIAGSFGRADGR